MPIVDFLIADKAAAVQVDASENLLDQALAQGLTVNYSCKRGDCGQCVGALLAGEVEAIDAARPCVQNGEVYLCNARARSDLAIRMPYSPETAHIKVLRTPCKIHELRYLSSDVAEVSFRIPSNTEFNYVPGQYVRLKNKERITRSYSLAEPPNADKLLRIHVRRVDEGVFSRYLFSTAKPGDLLHLEGPLGRFVLPQNRRASKTIFLATGTGIAPIHAILSSLAASQRQQCGEISLYWGNRFRSDAYFHAQLVSLAQRLNLQYFSVFSRERSEEASDASGYVQNLMADHHRNLESAQVFASGNIAMVDAARERCLSLRLAREDFHADPFTPS